MTSIGVFAAALMLMTGAAMAQAGPVAERFESGGRPITVDFFAAAGGGQGAKPALLLLHGADGLTVPGRYRTAASFLAASGYHVFLPHYLDRTGQTRASFSTIYTNFAAWQATVQDAVTYASRHAGVDAVFVDRKGVEAPEAAFVVPDLGDLPGIVRG